MNRPNPARVALVLGLLVTVSQALAQGSYSESFDPSVGSVASGAHGPATLISRGWTFRNQSQPAGDGDWYSYASYSHDGPACLVVDASVANLQNPSSTRASSWAILPAVSGQVAGDVLKFWVNNGLSAFGTPWGNAHLEVRYSPSGSIGTGSSATDVGNFTTLLVDHPQDTAGWTQISATLPGSGRIALRLVHAPNSQPFGFSGSFYIDSVSVGSPAGPVPLPAPGQTIHWTLAGSPYIVSTHPVTSNSIIPAGGTVIVDAGVEVRTTSGIQLIVAGNLRLEGTQANPVRLRGAVGAAGGWARISVSSGGTLTASFADIETYTDLIYGAKASFTDCAFRDPANPTEFSYDAAGDLGHRFFDGNLDYARQIISLNRCTFGQGCEVAVLRGWLAAKDCTFTRGAKVSLDPGAVGGEAIFVVGNAVFKNVVVNEAYVDLMSNHDQRRFIGDAVITGNPYGPGIRLEGGGSFLIDPTVTLQGHKWPVNFGVNSAGILPGSALPSTGNLFNEILDTDDPAPLDESTVWADAGIPYFAARNDVAHGQVTILPGVTVKVAPDTIFGFDTDSNGYAQPVFLGEPERPIRFVPSAPGTRWRGIGVGGIRFFGTRWDWCVIEDADYGISSRELPLALDNIVVRRSLRALGGDSLFSLRKCTLENNVYSYSAEFFAPVHDIGGFLDANHPANPNTFINNHGDPGPSYQFSVLPQGGMVARARHNSLEDTDSDVRNNWWGTATGPHHPTMNPSGTGDEVMFGVDAGGFLAPFLTQAPTADPPPVVRFVTNHIDVNPGEKVLVQWTARDNGRITTQRVYYSPDSNLDWKMQLLAEVPASARSFEWTPPVVGTQPNAPDQFVRIIAVDDLGQEGIADLVARVSNPSPFTGNMVPTSPVAGTYRPGDTLAACATVTPVLGSGTTASIELDNDERGISLGAFYISGSTGCTVGQVQVPDVSTDRARIRYDAVGSLNQVRSYYGPYFAIRPDPLIGDAAPSVSLTSVHAGQSYPGGSTISIAWTASDDESLRAFDIRASYDGGTRWFIVARDLPAAARAYDWKLPASQGIPSVKLRVVAWDRRFQNTSAESGLFAIAPGAYPAPCPADFNGDGTLGTQDIFDFLNAWLAASPTADFDGGGLSTQDIFAFLNAWFAGCP